MDERMATQSPASTEKMARPRRRWRRWALFGLAGVVVLFLLVVIGGEIVFATDIPRNLVVNALQAQLGLRVSAKSVSTGWLGHTTLRDVTVTLPLADKAFLTIPEAHVQHSTLPWLLITGQMVIHKIASDHVELDVVQDAQGNWNLQQVARMLSHPGSGSGSGGGNSSSGGGPSLPDLQLTDATIMIADDKNRSATITGLSLEGKAQGPLVWQCEAAVAGHLKAAAKIAPGGTWAHEIDLVVWNVQSWISPWVRTWPDSAHLTAQWIGQINGDQLNARVTLQSAQYGHATASGPIEISAADGKATIFPRSLRVRDRGYDATLDDGQIVVDADEVRSVGLALQFAGGRASVDGRAALSNGAASIHAIWRDVMLPAAVTQSGDLSLEFTPTLKEPRLKANLYTHGTVGASTWTAQIIVDGGGKDLQSLSISASAPKLLFQTAGQKTIDLSGFAAEISGSQDNVFSLKEFHLGNGQHIAGAGEYDMRDRSGWVTLDGRDWALPGTSSLVIDVDLKLSMAAQQLHLDKLYLRDGAWEAYAYGDCVLNARKQVNGRVYLMKVAENGLPLRPRLYTPGGSVTSELDLSGTVRPINLTFAGNASGTDVTIGSRSLGALKLAFAGAVHDDPRNLIRIDVESKNINLLGGNWTVGGSWPVEQSALRFNTVSVEHLSLPVLTARDDIQGTLDGKWSVDIKHFSATGITVKGSAQVRDFAIGKSAETPLLSAEQIDIPSIDIESGEANIQSVTAMHSQADQGRASFDLWAEVAHPTRVWISVDAAGWPVRSARFGDALASVGAKGELDTDLAHRSAWGNLDVSADLMLANQSIARLRVNSALSGRAIEAKHIQLLALDGTASGDGSINLDNPLGARADLSWSGADLGRLGGISPRWKDVSGVVDGSLQIHPATTPRPLEPLQVVVHVEPHNVQMAHIKLGAAQMFGYAGTDRFVLDDSLERPSQIAFAGGTINVWGRISKPAKDTFESLLELNLENINLDAVVPEDSKIARTPGSLNGTITIVGEPGSPELTFGEGNLTVSNSDLAEVGAVSFLYNLMHIGHNPKRAEGNGSVDFSIQGSTIFVNALRYFDRGTEIRASGYVDEYAQVPHCWIDITAVGSVRPFQSISLPGLADLDNALGAVQHDALAVRIAGYMDHLNAKDAVHTIPFSSIGHDLQAVIFGDVKSAKGQGSD